MGSTGYGTGTIMEDEVEDDKHCIPDGADQLEKS